MIKTKAVIEVKIGDQIFEFYCATHSGLGCVYDALTQMRSLVYEQIKKEEEKAQQSQSSCETKE